jgi:hypothetical protein
MNTIRLTAKKDYQGGYTLYYVGTSNVLGSYYPEKKKGWYYTPYTHAIITFEARTLSEAKKLIARERR